MSSLLSGIKFLPQGSGGDGDANSTSKCEERSRDDKRKHRRQPVRSSPPVRGQQRGSLDTYTDTNLDERPYQQDWINPTLEKRVAGESALDSRNSHKKHKKEHKKRKKHKKHKHRKHADDASGSDSDSRTSSSGGAINDEQATTAAPQAALDRDEWMAMVCRHPASLCLLGSGGIGSNTS